MALRAPPSLIPPPRPSPPVLPYTASAAAAGTATTEFRSSVPTTYLPAAAAAATTAEDDFSCATARDPTVIILTSPSSHQLLNSHHHQQQQQQHPHRYQHLSPSPPSRPPPPTISSISSATAATLQRSLNFQPKESETFFESILNFIIMAFCCFCCPAHKCAILTAIFEFILGIYFWFDAVNDAYKNSDNLQPKDIVIVFIFTAFCIAAGTALVTLFVAHRKKSPHFVWPRLVFVTGVLIICGILIALMFLYFSGAATGMNNFIIDVIQFVLKQNFTAVEREQLHGDLQKYALIFSVLLFFFTCYTLFGWCATRTFYHDLLKDYQNFHPVAQAEPTAPSQPAFNPNYAKGV